MIRIVSPEDLRGANTITDENEYIVVIKESQNGKVKIDRIIKLHPEIIKVDKWVKSDNRLYFNADYIDAITNTI